MKRNTVWIIGTILLVAILAFLPNLFYGPGGMMGSYGMGSNFMDQGDVTSGWADCGSGYGMMGGSWGSFGWPTSVIILVLVVTSGVWLGNALSNRGRVSSSTTVQSCPNCNKAVDANWSTCPYCGTSLK